MVERRLSHWERGVLEALLSVDGPPEGPDRAVLLESLPHLVVTGECECGCPSFFVRDVRDEPEEAESGSFHYSNAVTADGSVCLYLLVQGGRPWSIDVMLPPDIDGSSPEARPDPESLVVTSPYAS